MTLNFRIAACLALCFTAGCSSREAVVVYSPHGADILAVYEEKFEAAYPKYDMQWLDMGSQDVYNKIRASRARAVCDVWWGGPSFFFMQAAEDGALAVYEPSWAGAVPADARGTMNRWFATHDTPLAIMFNDRRYTADEVPQTWDDLLDDKWRGKITMRYPLPSGTMRTFIGAMIRRAESEDAGIEWLKKLHAATEDYMKSPQLLFDHIKRNPELLTVWIMPDAVLQRQLHGFPFGFHIPRETPVLVEAIALIEGAPNREGAELFYEFVTNPENLAQQAHAYAKVPTRTDIDPAQLPDWMGNLEIDSMGIDWREFKQHEKRWMARWEEEVFRAR